MKTRQHGLDLGRLIAMFFVIMLHEYAILTSMYPLLRTSPVGSSLGFGYQLTIIAKSFVNVFFLIRYAFRGRADLHGDLRDTAAKHSGKLGAVLIPCFLKW